MIGAEGGHAYGNGELITAGEPLVGRTVTTPDDLGIFAKDWGLPDRLF